MQIVNRKFRQRFGRGDSITLYDFADFHCGAVSCARDEIQVWVDRVKADPNAWWMGGGDWFNAIFVGDKRFDMRLSRNLDRELWAKAEGDIGLFRSVCLETMRDMFWPIFDRCLGLQVGNHEETVAARGQAALIAELVALYRDRCKQERVKPNPWVGQLSYNVVYLLSFQRSKGGSTNQVRVFATHGVGAAATPGGRLNKIESVLSWMPDCDLYVCRHFHDQVVHPRVRFRIVTGDDPHVEQVRRHIVLSPSFLRTYDDQTDTYAAKRLYPPSVIGCGMAKIWPFGDRERLGTRDNARPRIEVTV